MPDVALPLDVACSILFLHSGSATKKSSSLYHLVALPLVVTCSILFLHRGSATKIAGFLLSLVALPQSKSNHFQENKK